MLTGFLDSVTPARVYEYIRDDLKLCHWASESDWQHFRRMAQQANIGDLTSEQVIRELSKANPDVLDVILNHPQGRNWLDTQIADMKSKLGLE